jgi:transcriptional regulator with XRE-family HTH domain
MLAGISAEYYVRLERGSGRGVSEDVLDGIARALQLDDAERTHHFDLARASGERAKNRVSRRPAQERVRPAVQRILDSITAPAFVVSARSDLLASNTLGEALYADLYAGPERPVNTARFIFLNPHASEFFVDWDKVADDSIGVLRAQAGRDPHDRRLTDLIGELATRSEAFRVRWAAHDVRLHRTGTKRFHHRVVGDVALEFESLDLPGDPGQRLVVYTAEPHSASQQALDLLASWATTPADAPDEQRAASR